jgi:hypothetical protein
MKSNRITSMNKIKSPWANVLGRLILSLLLGLCVITAFGKVYAQTYPYWDPDFTSPFNDSDDYYPNGIAAYDGDIFISVGGDSNSGGILHWNNCDGWSTIGSLAGAACICIKGNYLYAGGVFSEIGNANGVTVQATNLAKYDLVNGTWSQVGDGSLPNVISIYVDDSGQVYAGVNQSYNNNASTVQKWNGNCWIGIPGLTGYNYPTSLVGDGTNIYVGGDFSGAYNGQTFISSPCVIKWNGISASWEPFSDPDINYSQDYTYDSERGFVISLALMGTNLFVAGDFTAEFASKSGDWNSPANQPPAGLYRYSTVTRQRLSFVGLTYAEATTVRVLVVENQLVTKIGLRILR